MYLGIDLGTSAVKVCVLSPEGAVAATASVALDISQPFEGASEQDCSDWWAATCKAVLALPPELRGRLAGIGLSGQMHGAVLLDVAGQPIRPAILWNDTRADADCQRLRAEEPDIGAISGVLPMPGFTAPKLSWLARHEPRTHARIAHVLLPKDYIGFCLHGGVVTDPSDAAGTSWLEERTRTWSQRLCTISATDPAWLPEIRQGNEIAGYLRADVARDLGMPAGLPVATGAGDAAAGAVGIGAVADGDGFISLGTSGQLFVTTATYRPNPESRIHAYAHTVPDHWFQMGVLLNGARPIAWLAETLGQPIGPLLDAAASAAPGPIFLPYLTGERTPHGDAAIRAGFWGLSETTTPAVMMRAVVEAIAFGFADAMAALEASGTRPKRLLAIGGGTQSDFLMQTVANVIGCPLGRSADADIGPALGAARLAQVAAGDGTLAEVAAKPEVAQWFTPNPDETADLAPRLAGYRALYPALRGVNDVVRKATRTTPEPS